MKKQIIILFLFPFFIIGVQPTLLSSGNASKLSINPVSSKEGNDFATIELGNAWDMDDFHDISKYLNTSGVAVSLDNIQFQNGIFSARSITNDSQFAPLFPGYIGGINLGNYGVNYPIYSETYRCLSFRMKIEDTSSLDDEIRVFWFADERLTGGPFGVSNVIRPESDVWKIYSLDLSSNFDKNNSNTPWTDQEYWQGIRIDPTKYSQKKFFVDWVRLTDCVPIPIAVTWTPTQGEVEVWMGRKLSSFETKLAGPINGNIGELKEIDVSGWESGVYYIGVKDLQTDYTEWTIFEIKEKPKLAINKPSYTSGEAVQWDMNNESEFKTSIDTTKCINYSFNNGILNTETLPPSSLPTNCTASGYSDPQIFLNLPDSQITASDFRYLSYKIKTDGAWQDINKGWVFRWLWYYYKNNDPSQWCINVTKPIAIDAEWETYSMDLYDPFIGTPEYSVGNNTQDFQPLLNWSQTGSIYNLRFDPNENDTNNSLFQHIDWISLNKIDEVKIGKIFPIQVSSLSDNILDLEFFYTTDISNPTQNMIQPYTTIYNNSQYYAENRVFLPLILKNYNPTVTTYNWNTTGVKPNEYYICIQATDDVGNFNTICSEAPVKVTSE
jgi:hypothetical protein